MESDVRMPLKPYLSLCILIPEEEGMYQEALTEIVTEINESQVDPKEVLSDQAYFYSAEDKRVHL